VKTFLRLIPLCFLVLFVSCGNIEDKQVTISFGEAKKAVRLGDYYWVKPTDGNTVIAADSNMNPVGIINSADNPSDYQTVLSFLKKSTE
jgi:hypothetical protein